MEALRGGFLWKKGGANYGRRTWKYRWFVLTEKQLVYFAIGNKYNPTEHPERLKRKGRVYLHAVTSVLPKRYKKRPNCFALTALKWQTHGVDNIEPREYILQAESALQVEAWIAAIRELCPRLGGGPAGEAERREPPPPEPILAGAAPPEPAASPTPTPEPEIEDDGAGVWGSAAPSPRIATEEGTSASLVTVVPAHGRRSTSATVPGTDDTDADADADVFGEEPRGMFDEELPLGTGHE